MEGRESVRRYFEELLSAPGNLDVAEEILTPDVEFRNPVSNDAIRGYDEYRAFAGRWYKGFPDRRFSIEELVEQGDTLAARFKITGTHLGEFAGAKPTGNPIEVNGVNIFHLDDGRIRFVRAFFNPLELWRPLGLAPETGPSVAKE